MDRGIEIRKSSQQGKGKRGDILSMVWGVKPGQMMHLELQ